MKAIQKKNERFELARDLILHQVKEPRGEQCLLSEN
jgi:hypothetical protein